MKKIDFRKLGDWTLELLRNNSSSIFGGLSMIGLALLCKKLNLPYAVLTDTPCVEDRCFSNHGRDVQGSNSVVLLTNDPVELSIESVYEAASTYSFDSQKVKAARDIIGILSANKDKNTNPGIYSFAIATLKKLSQTMLFDSSKKEVLDLITKIGRGEI